MKQKLLKINCISCNKKALKSKINFGEQPPSNRYQIISNCEKDTHILEIGICNECGLIQLIDPMPVEMVRSRYSWVKYNEPEFHLDDLVNKLIKLPGIESKSKIAGLTYKDETTLNRFSRKGYLNIHNTQILERNGDDGHFDGLETIQKIITEKKDLKLDSGIDLLMVRHVLEHAHDINTFLKNIVKNVKKEGYLVFEIPDSKKFLQSKNYCFVWEEHIVYFTEFTLRSFFERNGFEVVRIFRYEAVMEDSLVAVIRNTRKGEQEKATDAELAKELSAMDLYAGAFKEIKEIHYSFLKQAYHAGKKIAIFGAGHLAAKYINLFKLKDFVSCIIDDSKDKANLFMPGSSVMIRNSSFLSETDICLLVLSPESREKVLNSKRGMIKQGGEFYSAFDNKLISI